MFGFVSGAGHPGGVAGGGVGAAPRPPRPAPGAGPAANTLHASNVPSLFASRKTTIVLDAGELTNRSPFGAYAIMRGVGSSAYVVTVKPAGTVGMRPSGFGTVRLTLGDPVPGAGSASARGCGTAEFCCATTSTPADAIVTNEANTTTCFIATPAETQCYR